MDVYIKTMRYNYQISAHELLEFYPICKFDSKLKDL